MPHRPTEQRIRGTPFEIGPHLVRQLSSDHDGDGIHDLQWNTNGNLGDTHIIAACPFGGPIARAARQDQAVDYEKQIDNIVHIFSSTGDPLIDQNAMYNKVNRGNNLRDADGNPNYQPIIIADIGRQFNEDKSNATIVYMCWDDNDTLLVCLSNGMVWAFTSMGVPAAAAPLTVPGAFLFQTLEYGVAIITRRNTAVYVRLSGNTLTKEEAEIDIPPGGEVVSFAALPKNRFPAKIVDRVVGGTKTPMRMENTTHELIIATATEDINEACDIYLATFNTETNVARCFQLGIDREKFPKGNIVSFAVAPHKARIAMVMEYNDGADNIYACSSDFQYIHRIGNTQTEVIPSQVFWLGDEIVGYTLLNSQFDAEDDFKTAIITMPYAGDQHSFNPPSHADMEEDSFLVEVEITNMPVDAFVVQESDSIRILSSDTFQIIQVVPHEMRYMFADSGATTSSTSILASAYDEYATESPDCVEFINALMKKSNELDGAIDKLVALAGFELDVDVQKRWLRVANFGKSFSNTYVTDNFVNMCRRLKILQGLRSIGTLLSLDQLAAMEDTRLTQRLATHQHFQMAFEFADVLNLSVTPVLTIWAKHLLSSIPKAGDATQHERSSFFEIVTDMILSKFELNHNRGGEMPYVSVAHHAYKVGRSLGDQLYLDYALRIVNASPSARSRFDALLLWNQYQEALKVAVSCGDADMVYMVLAQSIENREEYEIEQSVIPMLNAYPESAALLRTFVQMVATDDGNGRGGGSSYDGSVANLVRVYKHLFREFESMRRLADYFAVESKARRDAGGGASAMLLDRNNGLLRDASRSVEDSLRSERGGAANTKMMHSQSYLIDKQAELFGRCNNKRFLNASVVDTIQLCYEHNRASDAQELAHYFTVSEKMLTWARLRAYVATENWDEVDKMASVRKSPIGYDPFVTLLMEADQPQQAAKHIPKLSPIERRMELYVACGDWRGACEDCLKNREEDMLGQLRSRAKTESAVAVIDAALRKAGR